MFVKYGKNDELEGVYESIKEAIQVYYKITPENKILFNKKKKIIYSSIWNVKYRNFKQGWYRI